MSFALEIPCIGKDPLRLTLHAGDVVFALGPNGAGKSALIHKLYTAHIASARRISAHRQTWLNSNTVSVSPEQKRNYDSMLQTADAQPQGRWKDDHSGHRAGLLIYNLIDAENLRARSIAAAVDGNDVELARVLSKRDAPIKVINELLRLSNIAIAISVEQNEQVMARKANGTPYSIAELSDGERNALLIATDVLTAKSGTLLLIDEPERHLHRSIICPLLTLLFGTRKDCAFVVSTHELSLPSGNPESRTLLVRGCRHTGSTVTSWDADEVPPGTEVDESLKRDILGARRTILFIEGDEQSLDKALYALIFPQVSIVPKASCRDVEHAVAGIRASQDLHWLRVLGLVDNDRRPGIELMDLRTKGIYAVSVFSVESIYYHPEIQRRVAERSATVTGEDPSKRLADARSAVLSALAPHARRLSERVAEKEIREEMLRHVPGRKEVAAGAPINVSIDVGAYVAKEQAQFELYVADGNVTALLSGYPVRETSALAEIARKLGFQGRDQYESAVRKLLMDDAEAITFVRSLFDGLDAALDTVPGSW